MNRPQPKTDLCLFSSLMYPWHLVGTQEIYTEWTKMLVDFVLCDSVFSSHLARKPIFCPSQYEQAVRELVRCMALTRICYGDSHWKLAEAHVNLAQGYLQLKGEFISNGGGRGRGNNPWVSALSCKCDSHITRRIQFSSIFSSPPIE